MPSETGLCFAGPKNRGCKASVPTTRPYGASLRFAEFVYALGLSSVSIFKCGSGRMRAREAFPSSARVSSAESGRACRNHPCRQPGKTSPFCTLEALFLPSKKGPLRTAEFNIGTARQHYNYQSNRYLSSNSILELRILPENS